LKIDSTKIKKVVQSYGSIGRWYMVLGKDAKSEMIWSPLIRLSGFRRGLWLESTRL